MKYIAISIVIISFSFNAVIAQQNTPVIPTHHLAVVRWVSYAIRVPAYIDSSLFARYIDWELQSASLPKTAKPVEKCHTIEIWYVVSKEGKISSAKSPGNKNDELANFIVEKFINCPYQWSPAFQNGRPVNSYHKMKIVF